MKNILPALLLLLTLPVFAQNQIISDFYDQYTEQEEVTDVKLQGWLLRLATNDESEAESEEVEVLKGISFLRVLVMSEGNLVKPHELKKFVKDLQKAEFAELMKIRDGSGSIDIFIREEGENVTDLTAIINDADDGFILLSLEGRIPFSELNNLNIEVEGMEHLKKIPEEKKDIPRA